LNLNIASEVLVINRVQGELALEILEEVKRQNLKLAGIIPKDEEVYQYDLEGKPTFRLPVESKGVRAARRIFEKYIQ